MSPVTLVGLSSQYTFSVPANDGYQILPRDSADVQPNGNLLITSAITQSNISTFGFDLSWSTSDNDQLNVIMELIQQIYQIIQLLETNVTNHIQF